MKEKEKNLYLSILNVFNRISDRKFIIEYWGRGQNYDSIVISCGEAIEMLNDFMFFELSKNDDFGEWNVVICYFSKELIENFVELSKSLDIFLKFDEPVNDLLLDINWIRIMEVAKKM